MGEIPLRVLTRNSLDRPHPNELRCRTVNREKNRQSNSQDPRNQTPASKPSDGASESGTGPHVHHPISPAEPGAEHLLRFFDHGIVSSNWESFEENGSIRIVYIGTDVANINHLVRNGEHPSSHCLHYPFPSIRDPLPWKPPPGIATCSFLTEDVIREVSSFPIRDVRDALVETYFSEIHPGWPIIDESQFRQQYANPDSPPPLLVFHAILLAAARLSDHPAVAGSRAMVTATLFRRAKALFDMRYENDRLHLVQAALLMAWHVENPDTVGCNAYHWIGSAVRIGLGLGIHRKAASRYLPEPERQTHRLYKKVFWSLLHAEAFVALELGRPCMIRAEDFDVGQLEDDDFHNLNESKDVFVKQDFCSTMAQLSLVVLDVLSLRAPRSKELGATHASVQQRLADFAFQVPSSNDMWSLQLRINYKLVVLTYYRTSDSPDAAAICSEAASDLLLSFENMSARGHIRLCCMTSPTALMAASIQFFQEVKFAVATGSFMKAASVFSQLERLYAPASALAEYWPNAEAVLRLCKNLSTRAETLIQTSRDQKASPQPSALDAVGFDANIDWQFIMADHQMLDFTAGTETQDWMGTSSWGNA